MFSLVEIVIALVVVVVLVLFGIVATNYKKSGPQAALIVYG